MFRGPVTVKPAFDDASSGVASKTVAVDGGDPQPLTTASFVVDGEGGHTVTFGAKDLAGNAMTKSFTFAIDTVAPELVTPEPVEGEQPRTVTPNGDGVTDTVAIPFSLSEASTVAATVAKADGTVVRTFKTNVAGGDRSVDWNGRDGAGKALPDGRYTVTLTPTDAAGNAGEPGNPGHGRRLRRPGDRGPHAGPVLPAGRRHADPVDEGDLDDAGTRDGDGRRA